MGERIGIQDEMADSLEQAIHLVAVAALGPYATTMAEKWTKTLAAYRKLHPFGMTQLDDLLPKMKKVLAEWTPPNK